MDKSFFSIEDKYCSNCGSNELKKDKYEDFCKVCGTVKENRKIRGIL